jgi:hypothetical protein
MCWTTPANYQCHPRALILKGTTNVFYIPANGIGTAPFMACGVKHADLMRAITEIKAEGEPADVGSRRSRNERRSDSIRSTPQIITQKQPSPTLPAFNPPSVQKFSHSLASC